MQIVERMMREPTFDPDKIQKMLDLKAQWDATEARKAFTVAMAAFKAIPPKIVKNKHVRFPSEKGVVEYDHATHSEVTEKIAAGLGQHGLSHRWNIEQSEGRIRVTCIITHSLGHAESVAMTADADNSGRKNHIQAIASAVSYLQRYTLLAATGLTSADMDKADDDGKGAGSKPETIDDNQVANLEALITEVKADKEKFLRYLKVSALSDILASSYSTAVKLLEAKRK
jgi:predicted transposase YbfD/YdcC